MGTQDCSLIDNTVTEPNTETTTDSESVNMEGPNWPRNTSGRMGWMGTNPDKMFMAMLRP